MILQLSISPGMVHDGLNAAIKSQLHKDTYQSTAVDMNHLYMLTMTLSTDTRGSSYLYV